MQFYIIFRIVVTYLTRNKSEKSILLYDWVFFRGKGGGSLA